MILFALDGSQKAIPIGSRNGSSRQGRISPNGKFFAFTSNESRRNEIYLQPMPPSTGQWKVSINGGQSPRWRGDGKELFFVSPDAEMMAVDITPDPVNPPGVPRRLFPLKSADPTDLANYDVRPDGQQFLILMRQRGTQDAPKPITAENRTTGSPTYVPLPWHVFAAFWRLVWVGCLVT